MRSLHRLHGVFDVAPFLGVFSIALGFGGQSFLRSLRDRLKAMFFEHLPGDGIDLGFRYHVGLLGVYENSRKKPPAGGIALINGERAVLFPPQRSPRSGGSNQLVRAIPPSTAISAPVT